MMFRFAFIAASLWCVASAQAQTSSLPAQTIRPAASQSADFDRVERHLLQVTTMTADFTQVAPGGAVTTGRMLLSRPGKVRFQYNGKYPLLVVANKGSLFVVDYKVAQLQRWPIGETPLAVLLDPKASLRARAQILESGPGALPGFVRVVAQDARHPEYGRLTVSFRQDPAGPAGLTLAGWEVFDAQGKTTRVTLHDVRVNTPVAASAFTFRDPRAGAAGRAGR